MAIRPSLRTVADIAMNTRITRRTLLKTAAVFAGSSVTAEVAAWAAQAAPGAAAVGADVAATATSENNPSLTFPAFHELSAWDQSGRWPASWVQCPEATDAPLVTAFRLVFEMPADATVRAHVTADERYELFLDGKRVGRGSERGNLEHWFYESYDLKLSAGNHCLVARVWSLGAFASLPQFHVRHEFLFAAEGEHQKLLSTGLAPWTCKKLDGYAFKSPVYVWGLSAPMTVDGRRFSWGFESGEGAGWTAVKPGERAASGLAAYGLAPARILRQGTLPPMMDQPWSYGTVRLVVAVTAPDTLRIPIDMSAQLADEARAWTALWKGESNLTVPARTCRRVLIDLEDYVCAYPELTVSGGSESLIRVQWAESLRHQPDMWKHEKGNRDEIEGKYFFGMGDSFLPDGGRDRRFDTLWWACGRYVEIVIQTQEEPLTVQRIVFHETRYPLEMATTFNCSDPQTNGLIPLLKRGMQMCAHETFVDCPYYEQMQYAADARIEALCSYLMTRDDRLPRKAMFLIDRSRHANGLTESRYPVREPQFIPWFSLLWIGMVHDYARWRNDPAFVRMLMPGIRAVLEAFLARLDSQGRLRTPEGWNNTDATRETGLSGLTHWLLIGTLQLAAELELAFGERELGARYERQASELAQVADQLFWDDNAGAYADSPDKRDFSEPVQCLAVLSGRIPERRLNVMRQTLQSSRSLRPATVHTTHYLFETCQRLGLAEKFYARLKFWHDLQRQGLKTPIETAEPTRSDCHAWAAHPLIHFYTLILGVRPSSFGFQSVVIAPQLGPLSHASGNLVHPQGGEISVAFRREGDRLRGQIKLPEGTTGVLRLPSGDTQLKPGWFEF
jgi:alpha-L-rhamnosidase